MYFYHRMPLLLPQDATSITIPTTGYHYYYYSYHRLPLFLSQHFYHTSLPQTTISTTLLPSLPLLTPSTARKSPNSRPPRTSPPSPRSFPKTTLIPTPFPSTTTPLFNTLQTSTTTTTRRSHYSTTSTLLLHTNLNTSNLTNALLTTISFQTISAKLSSQTTRLLFNPSRPLPSQKSSIYTTL